MQAIFIMFGSADSDQIIHFCNSNQFSNILIPYFAGPYICHKSCWASFCLQSTETKCMQACKPPKGNQTHCTH